MATVFLFLPRIGFKIDAQAFSVSAANGTWVGPREDQSYLQGPAASPPVIEVRRESCCG